MIHPSFDGRVQINYRVIHVVFVAEFREKLICDQWCLDKLVSCESKRLEPIFSGTRFNIAERI